MLDSMVMVLAENAGRSLFFQHGVRGPFFRVFFLGAFGDLLQIELRRTVFGVQLQNAPETHFRELEMPLLVTVKRLGKRFTPGTRLFGLLRTADQLMHGNERLESFEAETAQRARNKPFA